MATFGSEIINRQTIGDLVDAYEQACAEFNQGLQLLAQAETRLHNAFGAYNVHSDFGVIHYHRGPYWRYTEPESYFNETVKRWRSGAWLAIIEAAGVRKILTEKRQKELDEHLEKGEMPEITVQLILEWLSSIALGAGELQTELLMDVFEDLRPGARMHNRHKTNGRNEIGKKVILTGWVEYQYGYRVNYYRQDQLVRIDRAFHLLDGEGIPGGYKSPLVDAIGTSKESGKGETEYFRFKCYGNGNLHLEFRRLDLLKQLNAICGGAALRTPE